MDLSSEHALGVLSQGLLDSDRPDWQALPLLAAGDIASAEPQVVLNPANHSDKVGVVYEASLADVQSALQAAEAAAPRPGPPPGGRTRRLLAARGRRHGRQSGHADGPGDSRSGQIHPQRHRRSARAIDFCRYYAERISLEFNNDSHQALGPVVCISPWNFPLAIFTGEVAAALAAGNPVLAKPAEQTALIATLAVRLFHAAGVPRDAAATVAGPWRSGGRGADRRPAREGVIFTGSTEVAKLIHRTWLRSEEVPLIAETGGQNAMIVDSSALPEQVVADVINSAFDSAGQRCSALRILCLQEDIADKVVAMLKGAMDQLTVGNPAQLATDIGPVIDAEARAGLLAHIERMKGEPGLLSRRLGEHAAAMARLCRRRCLKSAALTSSSAKCLARCCMSSALPPRAAAADPRHQRHRLRPDLAYSRIDDTIDLVSRHRACGQYLRQPQYRWRRGRRAAVWRRRFVRHRPESRRPAVSAPPGLRQRRPAADCRRPKPGAGAPGPTARCTAR